MSKYPSVRLLQLPEGNNIGKEVNEAMKAIEDENDELKGVLPKTYTKLNNFETAQSELVVALLFT